MRSQPYLDDLEKVVPSRYNMVIGVAKRARQIMEENNESDYPGVVKPVSIAMWDILNKKIKIVEKPFTKKPESNTRTIQEFEDME